MRPLLRGAGVCFALAAALAPGAAGAGGRDFFETRIRPVLAENCYTCHGPEKQKAGLRLDHIRHILEGGESGPAAAPGDAGASRMVRAISYDDVDLQMPPKGRLGGAQRADLAAWIAAGAFWPEEPLPGAAANEEAEFNLMERAKAHWAWQPVAAALPPAAAGGADPIDRFIHARLRQEGLEPAARAGRQVLLRRLSYHLAGLPPTLAQRERFLADTAPGAYEREVDRLLASPAFGERWARHWMDLVRYSETYGHEQDFPIDHAWRYRDYVVRAFNADVPYDQFVREHIAGDLLEEPRYHPEEGHNESILATGFWFMYQATHAPVDPVQDRADRIDNQIDVLGKAFLGMTLACARCHDHKFDAVSTEDYYALGGFLRSSRRNIAFLDSGGLAARLARKLRENHAATQEKLRAYLPGLDAPPAAPLTRTLPGDSVVYEDFNGDSHHNWTAGGEAFADYKETGARWMAGGRLAFTPPGVLHSGPVSRALRGTLRSPDFTITHKNLHLRAAGADGKIRVIIEDYLLGDYHKLLFENTIFKVDTKGAFKWFSVTHSLRKYIGLQAYIEFEDANDGYLAVDEIVFSDLETPPASRAGAPAKAALDYSASSSPEVEALIAEHAQRSRRTTREMPELVRALTMTEGTPQDGRVYLRGDPKTPGAVQPRRFLEALGGLEDGPIENGSGRLRLAERIADPGNPLTARVMANRVWQYLLGRGLVPTPDNFGVLGEKPTHPELLDYLAASFVAEDWSVKRLIRRIVLSETYQMRSAPANPLAEERDPSNALLHRAHFRRLEGEVIRDALLAVSGALDESMYGPSVPIYLSPFMGGHRRPKTSGPLDGDGRRSLYVEVRRNYLSPMMLAFDTPVPDSTIGRRTESNVPAQALVMMNDPFVLAQAGRWAAQLVQNEEERGEDRITAMYLRALGRPPGPGERARIQDFMARQAASHGLGPAEAARDPRIWRELCHVIFTLKEFIYLP